MKEGTEAFCEMRNFSKVRSRFTGMVSDFRSEGSIGFVP
jgi:hypothetical protein